MSPKSSTHNLEKDFENTFPTVRSDFQNLRLGSINYCAKLQRRYTTEHCFYSTFQRSDETYAELHRLLHEYETQKKGKAVCIHGDAVLSNMLIDQNGHLKFVDMRGRLGDRLSIYGDWLYDWAKLFQSLVGYDEILQGKRVSHAYAMRMRRWFEVRFVQMHSQEDLANVLMITKSLLFTLLPLHKNDKCTAYYDLIRSIA